MIVRDATPADWRAIAILLAELGRPEVVGADEEDRHRSVFDRFLAAEENVVLVADVDEKVRGVLTMTYRPWLNFLGPQAWIADLVVDPGHRSLGLGAALLARAETLARARGCWGMALESATWRERAHAFYLREGWTDGGKAFTKNLAGEVWPPPPRA